LKKQDLAEYKHQIDRILGKVSRMQGFEKENLLLFFDSVLHVYSKENETHLIVKEIMEHLFDEV
jgi:hypothetical protein